MIELNIKISNPQDLNVLLPLLKRLGLSWEQRIHFEQKTDDAELKRLQQIIAAGGDTAYFGDPVEWQRKERQERNLPFSGTE